MILICTVLLAFWCASWAAAADADPAARAQQAEGLIAQLASPVYVERQGAAIELEALGLPAVEPLLASAESPDPEVAAASRRLLDRLAPRWARWDDSPSVRQVMSEYAQQSEQGRLAAVAALAAMPAGESASALVRIARFDTSPDVSETAGLLLIEQVAIAEEAALRAVLPAVIERVNRLAGPSQRASGRWCELLAAQVESPEDAIAPWREAVAGQSQRMAAQDPGRGSPGAGVLRWNLLRLELDADAPRDAVLETAEALVGSTEDQKEGYLERVLGWSGKAERWGVVQALVERHKDTLTSKRSRYLLADLAMLQGQQEQAQRLADEAYDTPATDRDARLNEDSPEIDGGVVVAQWLETRGRPEWAQREYYAATGDDAALNLSSVCAASWLADSLHDNGQEAESAEVIAALLSRIDATPESSRTYGQLADRWRVIPKVNTLRATEAFFRGLAAQAEGDAKQARDFYEQSWGFDPTNADVLIAMHRAAGDEDAQRDRVIDRIERLARSMQLMIEEDPLDPTPYNQWAWLVANTEGDYGKALRYSQRSLQLSPGNAGYLDTLGRCYFAVGDVQQAVDAQRLAVDKMPHLQVMRRQLEEFEQKLAEQHTPTK
ncbi:Tetratricopeptide repeat protein [Pirellulimonas nuda]|uniref:Tetratricopeptide repeat protein n=1 Tax=Pirellulimonas nuda TaxID=2528009 RepID=A0A518D6P0_9BACT|nr:hypothetical protein [Pirellulimonas nuda]QDU87153.1 Tetratricopeptide repeat protein [Pirellulimonas nuda]